MKAIVIVLCILFSLSAHAADKKLAVLVYDGVLTSDVTAAVEVFGVASRESWFSDFRVITLALEPTDSITTEEGLRIGVDAWVGEVGELDALITTSSYDMEKHLSNKHLKMLIRKIHQSGGYLASNCSGAQFLAEAGVLDNRKATTYFGGEKSFAKRYPKVDVQENVNVVSDGRIVTSNGSIVSYQAALTLLRQMSSASNAQKVAEAIQYQRLSSEPF